MLTDFKVWWKKIMKTEINLDLEVILLGNVQGSKLENICTLELKSYTYFARSQEVILSINGYIHKLKRRFIIEREIALKHGTISKIMERWGALDIIWSS